MWVSPSSRDAGRSNWKKKLSDEFCAPKKRNKGCVGSRGAHLVGLEVVEPVSGPGEGVLDVVHDGLLHAQHVVLGVRVHERVQQILLPRVGLEEGGGVLRPGALVGFEVVRVEDHLDDLLDVGEIVDVVHLGAVIAGDVEGVRGEVTLHVHLRLLHAQPEVLQRRLHELQDPRPVCSLDRDDCELRVAVAVDDDGEVRVALDVASDVRAFGDRAGHSARSADVHAVQRNRGGATRPDDEGVGAPPRVLAP